MGRRGPAKTPSRLLELRGSWLAQTRKRGGEPTPVRSRLRKPRTLAPEAGKVWDRVVRQLRGSGVLTQWDEDALARYCELYALYEEMLAFVRKAGSTYPVKDKHGNVDVKPNPQVRNVIRLAEVLNRMAQQFGLTPSARADLALQGPTPASDLDGYFEPMGSTG